MPLNSEEREYRDQGGYKAVRSPRNNEHHYQVQREQLQLIINALSGDRQQRVQALLDKIDRKWERLRSLNRLRERRAA